ncbi:MAG: 5-oxoprolinase subunit PxpB [Alphaproteobacteria bacterium]|nr:5-oxoprolinase subunit PxpB [Alphaproteobacteria bacterium]
MADGPKFLPAGESGLLVELGDAIDPALNALVHRLDGLIGQARLAGVIETVPTYRSLLVVFDPLATESARLEDSVRALWPRAQASEAGGQGRRWFVPVAFGGELGMDLDDVARRTGLSAAEVVARHEATDYIVYMLGFAPGFAYLGTLDEKLRLPRRETPRLAVPPGAIMQGGAQACVSTLEMPSGWHVLGRTPSPIYDPGRERPFLLAPGDRVRFVSIPAGEFENRAKALPDSEALA